MSFGKSLIALIAVIITLPISATQTAAAEYEDKSCVEKKVQGQGRPNKMQSMANMNAIIDWINVTKKEHGTEFAQWHAAIESSVKCRKAGVYSICLAEGKPCKPKEKGAEAKTK